MGTEDVELRNELDGSVEIFVAIPVEIPWRFLIRKGHRPFLILGG